MSQSSNSAHKKVGLPPGSLIHIGNKKTDKVRISVIDYDNDNFVEEEFTAIEDVFTFRNKESVSWINVDGLHDIDLIAKLGNCFDLHPLILEDILNTKHRPKTEIFNDYIFVTIKMLGINKSANAVITEQVSFVLGKSWLISFQEKQGDLFDPLRTRLRESVGSIREKDVDYLMYRLIDLVVDNYFFVIEHYNSKIEKLEEKALSNPSEKILHEIQQTKKQLIYLRKSTAPLREAISLLEKDSLNIIKESTTRYLRDVYEHIIQINDTINTQKDMLSSIMDLYMTSLSNKMNEVMKVLTVIATIFIPLTFIAGVYGMNFDYMPELHMKYGYFGVWGVMLLMFIAMLIYFKRKDWL